MSAHKNYEKTSKDVEWYAREIPEGMFSDSMRAVLREYSGIPDDQAEEHVHDIRDKAWDVFPYGCTGHFTFLQLSIGDAPQYGDVLRRVKGGERLLDLGCNFGQDLRKLVFDGAPSANLYGSDLDERFFSLGYDLFKDRASFQATFVAADAVAESSALDELQGTFSMIHASSFFHLFDWPTQVKVGARCVSLLQRKPGSMIFGRQVGNLTAGNHPNRIAKTLGISTDLFTHNEESWRQLWDEIGALTGTKWHVESFMFVDEMTRSLNVQREGRRRMRFAVWME